MNNELESQRNEVTSFHFWHYSVVDMGGKTDENHKKP